MSARPHGRHRAGGASSASLLLDAVTRSSAPTLKLAAAAVAAGGLAATVTSPALAGTLPAAVPTVKPAPARPAPSAGRVGATFTPAPFARVGVAAPTAPPRAWKPVPVPVVKRVAKPVVKPVVTPKAKPVAKPVVKPKPKPAVKPVVKPLVKAKPVAKPVLKPTVTKAVVKPKVTKPVVKPPVTRPVAKPAGAAPAPRPVAAPSVPRLVPAPELPDVTSSRSGARPALPTTPQVPAPPTERLTSETRPASGSALDIAASLSGIWYVYGGSTPAGFDCSGFTSYVFRQAGTTLPRTAAAQQAATTPVSDPQPGDLVFFGSPAHHVGIFAGNGMMYDSPRTGKQTGLHKIWSSSVTYGRP